MGDHEQYGIEGCASADEYNADKIKKHEFTRKAKEDDRTKHVITLNANTGPVFLTYRDKKEINEAIKELRKQKITYEVSIKSIQLLTLKNDSIKKIRQFRL